MLGGLFVYPTGTLRSTALRWDSEAKRKGSADEKVGKMAQESDITAAHRCDDQEPQETKIRAFVPPRPRDRHKPKKSDSRAGYWCRRTAFLAKKVAVATREAREAKEMVRAMQEQMSEMKQLLVTPLRQGEQQRGLATRRLQAAIRGHRDRRVVQVSVAEEQAADTQELLAPLVHQSPSARATDAQQVEAASRLQAVIRGRCELITGRVRDLDQPDVWQGWYAHVRRLRFFRLHFDMTYGADHWHVHIDTWNQFRWTRRWSPDGRNVPSWVSSSSKYRALV